MGPFITMLGNLYRLFMEKNASLIEINPLVITQDKKLMALDGKVSIDDNALFKHPDIQAMRDQHEEEPLEIEATNNNLNYVKLDGSIGCMVNGAGLAMATMDVIKLAGSEPANFLDVGGGATKETVAAGFRILLKDRNVKGIFINIFGGIVRCERIAHGVIEAAKEVDIRIPVVVRLQGTNADEGRKLLQESGLKIEVATDLWEAAQKIVALTGKRRREHAGQQEHAGGAAGDHGQGGVVPRHAVQGLRHAGRRRRDARQGRPGGRGDPGLQHRPRRGEDDSV